MKQNNNLFFLLISFVFVSACWVGFNVYHAFVTSTITPEVAESIQPIQPNFNTKVIEQLKERKEIPVDETLELPTEVSPTPTPTEITQPTAVPTPEIEEAISPTP